MNPKLDNITIDLSNDKFKEECGVFGIYSNKSLDLASVIYYGLYALQHRGDVYKRQTLKIIKLV